MKIILLIVLFLFRFVLGVTAQVAEEHIFIGALTIEGASPFSYRIQFKDSGNIINGFSITDMQGPDQTRTAIKGSINPDKKEFVFRETRLINTKSKTSRDSFCYINARLKLAKKKGNRMLTGTFTGYMKDGKTTCGKGEIMLVSKDDVLNKLMKLGPKADTIVKVVKEIDDAHTKQVAEDDDVLDAEPKEAYLAVRPGRTASLGCKGGEAVLELWDNNKVDGDVITLRHNDEVLLEHFKTTAARERMVVKLQPDKESRISLIAENEGSEPPVTVRMICTCQDKTYTIDASSVIGTPVALILN